MELNMARLLPALLPAWRQWTTSSCGVLLAALFYIVHQKIISEHYDRSASEDEDARCRGLEGQRKWR
jgi:hypothetical protein